MDRNLPYEWTNGQPADRQITLQVSGLLHNKMLMVPSKEILWHDMNFWIEMKNLLKDICQRHFVSLWIMHALNAESIFPSLLDAAL